MNKAQLPTHVPPMSYSDAATLLPLLWKWLHRGTPQVGRSAFPASLYLPVGCKYYHLVCVLQSEKVWEALPWVKIHGNSNLYITHGYSLFTEAGPPILDVLWFIANPFS